TEMERAELEVAGAHPFRPGTVDADGQLRRRVGLPGDLDGARGDPHLLFLGQAEDLPAGRAMHHLPERDLASIAQHGLADEVRDQAVDGLVITFPEPEPVRERALTELDERPGLDRQPMATTPGQLGTEP